MMKILDYQVSMQFGLPGAAQYVALFIWEKMEEG
jgi:hypothetical protein